MRLGGGVGANKIGDVGPCGKHVPEAVSAVFPGH